MTTSTQRLGAKKPAASQTKARARAIKARVLAKKALKANPSAAGKSTRIIYTEAGGLELARLKAGLAAHNIRYEIRRPDTCDAFERASQTRRLEVWVNVMPPELDEYHPRNPHRRIDLLSHIIRVTERRAVLCTEVGWSGRGGDGWAEDLWRIEFFDDIPVDQWNERVCVRCACDAKFVSDEGLWWCGRHMTHAWWKFEHVDGVSWQEPRMLEVGA